MLITLSVIIINKIQDPFVNLFLIDDLVNLIRSNLCNYSYAYRHVKGYVAVPKTAASSSPVNNGNRKVIFKNCIALTSCISQIIDTQEDDSKDIDILLPMYNLTEYGNAY